MLTMLSLAIHFEVEAYVRLSERKMYINKSTKNEVKKIYQWKFKSPIACYQRDTETLDMK